MAAQSTVTRHMEPALIGLGLVVAASALSIGAILLSRGGREVPLSPALPIDPPASTESAAPAPNIVPGSLVPVIEPLPTLAPRASFQPTSPTPAAPGAPYKDYSTDPGGGEKLPHR